MSLKNMRAFTADPHWLNEAKMGGLLSIYIMTIQGAAVLTQPYCRAIHRLPAAR